MGSTGAQERRGIERLKEFFRPDEPSGSVDDSGLKVHAAPDGSGAEQAARAQVPVLGERARPSPVIARPESPGDPTGEMEQLKLIDDDAYAVLPPMSILRTPPRRRGRKEVEDPRGMAELLESTLASFGVEATVVGVSAGPVVTRFEVQPGPGVKVSKIVNLADDLSLAFASAGVTNRGPDPREGGCRHRSSQ